MDYELPSFFECWKAIKSSGELLTSAERWILTVMIGFCNFKHPDGAYIWPSDATIAEQAAVTRRTVRACRRSFRCMGLMRWDRNPGGSNYTFIDLDGGITDETLTAIREIEGVLTLRHLPQAG